MPQFNLMPFNCQVKNEVERPLATKRTGQQIFHSLTVKLIYFTCFVVVVRNVRKKIERPGCNNSRRNLISFFLYV